MFALSLLALAAGAVTLSFAALLTVAFAIWRDPSFSRTAFWAAGVGLALCLGGAYLFHQEMVQPDSTPSNP